MAPATRDLRRPRSIQQRTVLSDDRGSLVAAATDAHKQRQMNSAMGGWHGGLEPRGLRDSDVLLAFVVGLILAVSWCSGMARSIVEFWAA
jgi:hypothetical protein